MQPAPSAHFLSGLRVLEIADELGEYCGKVLAGLGAEVIKIEPPGGNVTRGYGPFYEDRPGPERSLHFWHYNQGKRSIVLDLATAEGRQKLHALAGSAEVLLDTTPRAKRGPRGLDFAQLSTLNPALIVARITPFGDTGPWADYQASDLVHLALGGVMMNNGYDPEPSGRYDAPPIAPQMWQAYHIAGEMTCMAILAALLHRGQGGEGQLLTTAVHEAVAQQTENDVPDWIYAKVPRHRFTCRHAAFSTPAGGIALTKDGRWLIAGAIAPQIGTPYFDAIVKLLDRHGLGDELKAPEFYDPKNARNPLITQRLSDACTRFIQKFLYSRDIWREAQALGLIWAPLRQPEENLEDPHWRDRETFLEVEHPELGRRFTYAGARWVCKALPWRNGPRAPVLDEHGKDILRELAAPRAPFVSRGKAAPPVVGRSIAGRRFPLQGVRMIDLGWMVASAGAGRYLAALGAEVIRIEHSSRLDKIRHAPIGLPPTGGRAERDAARGPIHMPHPDSPNRCGLFNDTNAGKRSLSLNLKSEQGREIFRRLIQKADVLTEGFTAGTMDKLGFGYAVLQKLNPSIVYVQQSGMGQIGQYPGLASNGPIAQGFSGLSEMSGFPSPYPPAGIGYSFLDWFGAYNMANAVLAGLNYRQASGKGVWIDSSQVEAGIVLTGTAILDYSANGRPWARYGNASPYKPAAPHGAYRCKGADDWIAIACFDEPGWQSLCRTLERRAWLEDPRFATLQARLANVAALDVALNEVCQTWERYALQAALQAAGVAAGVCQTAQDRCDRDPQLAHLEWLTELPHSEVGTWPVKGFPVKMSATPAHVGGLPGRSGPCYGEDNRYVLGEVLGLSDEEIEKLARAGAL